MNEFFLLLVLAAYLIGIVALVVGFALYCWIALPTKLRVEVLPKEGEARPPGAAHSESGSPPSGKKIPEKA